MTPAFKRRRARVGALTFAFAALFGLLALKLAALVVFDGPRLNSLAKSEHTGEQEVAAVRGPIVDRNGRPLALSAETRSVYVRPKRLLEGSTSYERARLAVAVGLTAAGLEAKLRRREPFVWLARHLPPAKARAVEQLGLPGVATLSEYQRFYPESDLAASVVGLAGVDGQGLSGLELEYDRLVRGEPLELRFYHDALGHPILDSPVALHNPAPGAPLELTIDAEIQALAESRLAEEVRQSGARAGTAVVLDPFTGEVLALANAQSGAAPRHERLHDAAVQDAFEPGSTIKGILGAIALEDGAVTGGERVYCENGEWRLGRAAIHDDEPHGWLSLPDIIRVSSNIGAAKIALGLGAERYYDGLAAFGIGRKTGIDLPGEALGLLRPASSWRAIDLADHGFGQGVAVTPIQLAVAYAAIANGGLIVRPFVVKAAYDADGRPLLTHTPQVLRRAVSPAVAHTMNRLLQSVVNAPGGTGGLARVEGFMVAGKTGTAQMVDPATGAYYQHRLVASFVGFVPANDPRLVILVVLYDVARGHFGGLVAAPTFSQIAAGALRTLDVASPQALGTLSASLLPTGLTAAEAEPETAGPPAGGQRQAPGDGLSAPNFTGLSLRSAVQLAKRRGVLVEVEGSGYVLRQTPAPGRLLDRGPVRLELAPVTDEPPVRRAAAPVRIARARRGG